MKIINEYINYVKDKYPGFLYSRDLGISNLKDEIENFSNKLLLSGKIKDFCFIDVKDGFCLFLDSYNSIQLIFTIDEDHKIFLSYSPNLNKEKSNMLFNKFSI